VNFDGIISCSDPNPNVFVAEFNDQLEVNWVHCTTLPVSATQSNSEAHSVVSHNNIITLIGIASGEVNFDQLSYSSSEEVSEIFVAQLSNPTTTAGYHSEEALEVLIYPVPANKNITVLVKGAKDHLQINIQNIQGQVIYREGFAFNGTFKKIFDLNTYPNGIYFIEIVADGKRSSRKVVLQ
jgi:hypothetical protein